jgi:glucose/arabinose dehydrogenase
MEVAPDGRVFVCLQSGQVRVIKNGILLAAPFLTLTPDSSGERGLLGVAFDPNFQTNNFIYVYYTATTTPRHNRVSRFTANGDVVVPGSELTILDLDNLSNATNHNGGAIHFGPDGKMYVAVGENANGTNSQTLNNRLGKMLRINSDGSIPSDNPFFNTATGLNKSIWALGLRNPFTFAFQPGTGRMFINDVGQDTWEEINDGIAGSNYGWPDTEGATPDPRFRSPLFAYGHGTGATTGCAIAGGTFYNPTTVQFPSSFVGKYFFADLCSGWIRVLDPSNNTASGFATGINQPVDLKVAADGSLYYLSIGAGAVFKVQVPANQVPPGITMEPANQTVLEGQPVTFIVTANGATPLAFQWQRNTINISAANAASYMISAAVLADNGAKFRCVVTNAFGNATSNEATLTVNPNTAPPILQFEDNTDHLIGFDSVNMLPDPFPLDTTFNFSGDHRTRIMLFALNADLLPGESASAVTARVEDGQLRTLPATVEFVGPINVPNLNGLTEIVVRLPDELAGTSGDVFVSITLHGKTSNRVRFRMQ